MVAEEGGSVEYRQADRRRQLDDPPRAVAELRASRMRLVLAADAERRSFEDELHRSVQQDLVGLAANLELAAASAESDPAAAQQLLAEMRRDVQRTLEETRALAQRIYPPLLEAGGLGIALRSAAASAGVPIRSDVAAAKDCPTEFAAAVYFCSKEMIDRVEEGTPVTVAARSVDGVLEFEIVAGCAVDTGDLLRDRVEALGGDLTVTRESDEQTRVACSLPLAR